METIPSISEDLVLYSDNHLLIVNKPARIGVQGDKSGDVPLVEMVREYIRVKFEKPGNVFCGLIHRLDRPVSGAIIFARTSKALERMNKQFANTHPKNGDWALGENPPTAKEMYLVGPLERTGQQNTSDR
ncbi:MAG: pseudouridine synthase, partial [Fluviicola sp.]